MPGLKPRPTLRCMGRSRPPTTDAPYDDSDPDADWNNCSTDLRFITRNVQTPRAVPYGSSRHVKPAKTPQWRGARARARKGGAIYAWSTWRAWS
jgi:hypothetical protein